MREQKTPDWSLMIQQMIGRGMTTRQIGQSMSVDLTQRMVQHYMLGTQPQHWRGEALIELWCKTLNRTRDDLPQMALIRGHRVDNNREPIGPRLQSLPVWPPRK